MELTANELREKVYWVLDEVIETGQPAHIVRNGHRLRIVADQAPGRLARIVSRPDVVVGDSEDFVHLDWCK